MANRKACAACRRAGRSCPPDCIFAPYFPANEPERFECVHTVFGERNVRRWLEVVDADGRRDVAESLCNEARWRIQDPAGFYARIMVIPETMQRHRDLELRLAEIRTRYAFLLIRLAFFLILLAFFAFLANVFH